MKKMNKKSVIYTLIFALSMTMFSCVDDEFDTPPERTIPEGDPITIQEVKNLFNDEGDYQFTTDQSIYAVVTMDDKSGNIYKTAYIQDHTGAIALHMDASGGLYEGDSIRIQLNGLKVGQYENLFQIDAPDGNGFTMDEYITKLDTRVDVAPEQVTILDIVSGMDYYQCRIVKLDNVQFIPSDTSKTYANGDDLITENRTIEDQDGNTLIIRTSGYASFANDAVPNGSGSLVAIVGQYRDDVQLYIRSAEEVNMNNERFDVIESVISFDNFGTQGQFYQYSVTGDQVWTLATYGYAKMTGYDGSQFANEDWLISSALDLTDKSNVILNFRHTAGYVYTGVWDDLQLLVSDDYSGSGDPNEATWTSYTFTTPPAEPFWTWVDSGDIDLSAHDGNNNVYVAFKYVSTTSNCATWEIEDIVLSEGI
ncbi:MAG: DUF5689 domain-containing protein [Bacteroidales bacterium]|jgi:hypothetical protein|nr:DUF5689 domain-containing protein [Bacteroidales bacterium]